LKESGGGGGEWQHTKVSQFNADDGVGERGAKRKVRPAAWTEMGGELTGL